MSAPRLRLRVTRAAESRLRDGHPWLYESSILEQNRPGAAGDLGVVYGRDDRFLAVGLYDPSSPLALRVLHAGKPLPIDRDFYASRLAGAIERREGTVGDDTNGYRVLNGESDSFPGLVLDRYAGTLVLKLYTHAWFPNWQPVLESIEAAFPGSSLALRLSRSITPSRKPRSWAAAGASRSHSKTSACTVSCGQALTWGSAAFSAKLRSAASSACGLMSRLVTDRAPPRAA